MTAVAEAAKARHPIAVSDDVPAHCCFAAERMCRASMPVRLDYRARYLHRANLETAPLARYNVNMGLVMSLSFSKKDANQQSPTPGKDGMFTLPQTHKRTNPRTLLVVVGRFPCASETFILNELTALEECGYSLKVVSCAPRERCDDRDETGIRGSVIYGPRISVLEVFCSLLRQIARSPVSTGRLFAMALACVPHSLHGIWRAATATIIASRVAPHLKDSVASHIHAHFIHAPALVTKLLARALGTSHSISAHARDVFVPDYRAGALCDGASFIVVCSESAREALVSRLPEAVTHRVQVCYHGVDLTSFEFPHRRNAGEETSDVVSTGREGPGVTLCLVSVCRLVPKKGLDVVLRTLAILKGRGVRFVYRIAGAGPEVSALRILSRRLGLDEVEFLGTCDAGQVRALLAWADAFVLGCRVTHDGDRDGIPNVILEAMAAGVPVVASDAGGVREVVRHHDTGWLLPADDPQAMADALHELMSDPALCDRVVARARAEVEKRFDRKRNIAGLIDMLKRGINRPCAH